MVSDSSINGGLGCSFYPESYSCVRAYPVCPRHRRHFGQADLTVSIFFIPWMRTTPYAPNQQLDNKQAK